MAVTHVTDKSFDEFVSTSGVAVVDFWADHCGPCKAIKPFVEGIATKLAGQVKIGMVDVDEECKLAGRMDIGSIPHFNIYKDGEIVDTIVGALPPDKLLARISSHLG